MKLVTLAAATTLFAASTVAFAAPEVELTILGGQSTFSNSSFHATDKEGTSVGEEQARHTDINSDDMSADFAPGLRLGVRVGDSPVLVTVGARHSDHLDTSYDVGVRLNKRGSNLGAEVRAVRFEDSAVRSAFGSRDVEAEAVVTYDVASFLRLGAGVTTATLDDQEVNGLLTADVVFKFGGPKAAAPVVVVPVAPAPRKPVPAPIVESTGERG